MKHNVKMPSNPAPTTFEQAAEEFRERELEDAVIMKPPDGGYGWVVVFASFLANVIVDGIIFTVGGILLPLWQVSFECSETAASLTMSILSGTYLLVGPLASALANLYGCRRVVMAGTLLAFFGFICSTIAPKIYVVYLSFGIVGGVGFGLIYLPAIVIISQYFAEKRSLATGLAVCGSGIGTMLYSTINPIAMNLFDQSWRLFIVYLSVSILFCFFCAIIYRPVRPEKKQLDKIADYALRVEEKIHQQKQEEAAREPPRLIIRSGPFAQKPPEEPKFNPARPFSSTIELNVNKANLNHHTTSNKNLVEAAARDSIRDLNRPLSRQDVFYTGSTTNLRARSRTMSVNRDFQQVQPALETFDMASSNVYISQLGLPSQIAEATTGVKSSEPRWKQDLKATLSSLLDMTLLTSPSFMILAFSGLLTLSCFYVPYNYLGNHLDRIEGLTATQKAIPLSLLGIINIFARIGCGWIADQPQVDALMVSNIAVIAAGFATALVPFMTQYWQFIAFCFPFACGVACFAALRSVICVDLFGLDKLSNAFGILLTFMGVGAIIGSPLAAFVKDITGNFDISFYIMGGLMALSGIICLPLRRLRAKEEIKIAQAEAKTATELEPLNGH